MKWIKTIASFTLLTGFFFTHGQTAKFKFLVEHETKGIARNLILLVNNENVITNDAGIFTLTLNEAVNNVLVQSYNKQKYVIRYPLNGAVSLPRNPGDIIRITIDEPTKQELAADYKKKITVEFSKLQKQLDSLTSSNNKMRDELLARIDSLIADAAKNNISKEELRTARELLDGRDKNFPEISSTLSAYVNEARDLNDAFKTISQAFTRHEAYDQLVSSIKSYNDVYEKLNSNKDNYQKAIGDYWQSKELSYTFLNLSEFALNEIHRPYVLPLNDVIGKINEYSTLSSKKEKRKFKEQITDNIADSNRQLERRLVILGEKTNTLLTILKSDY